jgi:uncharacterized protein (TIGR02466 family)
MEREHEQLTARFKTVDIFALDHPGISWLRKGIDQTAEAYFQAVGMKYRIEWSVSGWSNTNRFGDYHAPHNHAWSYLSGTYYLKMPDDGRPPPEPASDRSASISFYDPRTAVSMLAVAGEPLGQFEYAIRPEQGSVMMWDASILHSVHPNLSRDTRMTISFNISVTWSEQALGAT